ncbi:MAG: 3-oxo-tetronate kinase [Roseibium sp.]
MKLGVIADDFTGASDIALMLSEGGMPTVQYVGVPTEKATPDVAAGVISLKSRTAPIQEAIVTSLAAVDWLLAQGCEQIIFKVCSTFDSTPAGNIGPVTEALAEKLGETSVLVCPAFPENGRTVFQGHLFVKDTLLSESGMQNHPLTPMTDPDLRRVLADQTSWDVGHIATDTVWSGPDAMTNAMAGLGKSMIIVDAIRNEDLVTIGQAAKSRKLMTGGSGIALGLPANFGYSPASNTWTGETGNAVILSGSCSTATRGQVLTYKTHAPSRELLAGDIMDGKIVLSELVNWVLEQDKTPLLYSSADPAIVAAAQDRYGREKCAAAIEGLFSDLAGALANAGVERIVVAGGETSGAVVSGLNANILEIGPKIAAGVPALKVSGRPLTLALKSGNFGGPDFFVEALSILESRS